MNLLNNTQKRKNSGFTLVELLVTMALMGMVMVIAGSFFNFSTLFEKKAEAEVDFQSNMRQASRVLNNSIRDSSVTFTLPAEQFSKAKIKQWNYLGIEGGKQIVQYVWNTTTLTHDAIVLVPSSAAISYNLYFNQNKKDTKLIEFSLEGYADGGANKNLLINSEIVAMNSLAVDDGGSLNNPAVALAYRSDPVPKPTNVKMLVALVIDTSGSMGNSMSTSTRLGVMKTEAHNFIVELTKYKIASLSIIPFAKLAYPNSFIDCTTSNASILETKITSLEATGGTNTGEALRRAYYTIESYRDDYKTTTDAGMRFYSSVILLTDGNPTYRTSKYTSYYDAETTDKIRNEDYVFLNGVENSSNVTAGMQYVNAIAPKYNTSTSGITTYVIGLGEGAGGNWSNVQTIATSYNFNKTKDYFFAAGTAASLKDAFISIKADMLESMWHIYGPYS